jgi:hypothetical protein
LCPNPYHTAGWDLNGEQQAETMYGAGIESDPFLSGPDRRGNGQRNGNLGSNNEKVCSAYGTASAVLDRTISQQASADMRHRLCHDESADKLQPSTTPIA